MKILTFTLILLVSTLSFAATKKKSDKDVESFNKVKNVYVSHLQQKIIFMSEMTKCMAEGKSFDDLKTCSKNGKSKIAQLDKKAHEAHLRAKKKKSAQ